MCVPRMLGQERGSERGEKRVMLVGERMRLLLLKREGRERGEMSVRKEGHTRGRYATVS